MIPAIRFFLAGLLLLVLSLSLIVIWKVSPVLLTPMIGKEDPKVIITVAPSSTAYQFAHQLEEKKLIQSSKLLLAYIRYKGWSNQLKAGIYQIEPGETVASFVSRVIAGDVLIQKFGIIAGTKQDKISQDLTNAPYLNYNPTDWNEIKGDKANAEGLLLADTYHYAAGSAAKKLLKQAQLNLNTTLTKAWESREPGLPYKTAYELLIAASIIEKESANPYERKIIAGVLVNRINKKMPLQMDPTVMYGLKGKEKLSHEDMLIPTPYNTYLYRGLPPTPIAMVGKEAIEAAAHPQGSNFLYYVAKGDGTHQFSQTYDEQKKAIQQYLRKD